MVNFNAVVNNEDMVKGLNKLIHANASLRSSLSTAEEGLENRQLVDEVRQLSSMHQRHIERIGETVRVLGGAPDHDSGSNWGSEAKMQLHKLGHDESLLSEIENQEHKLFERYTDTRDQLRASPEVVGVIEELLRDSSDKLHHLKQVAGDK